MCAYELSPVWEKIEHNILAMNVLIIKNGRCKTYVDQILHQIDNSINCTIVMASELDGIKLPDGVIILGGTVSVLDLDTDKNLQMVIEFIGRCDECKVPVLGICLGCQLIAKYFDCQIGKNDRPICGFKKEILVHDQDELSKIIHKNRDYYISFHWDYIIPSGHVSIHATYEEYPYYIRKDNFIGIQFHPDVVDHNFEKFLKCFNLSELERQTISGYYNANKENILQSSKELFEYWVNHV